MKGIDKLKIDWDEERMSAPFGYREKIVIRLVILLINIVAPASYSHQVRGAMETVFSKEQI